MFGAIVALSLVLLGWVALARLFDGAPSLPTWAGYLISALIMSLILVIFGAGVGLSLFLFTGMVCLVGVVGAVTTVQSGIAKDQKASRLWKSHEELRKLKEEADIKLRVEKEVNQRLARYAERKIHE